MAVPIGGMEMLKAKYYQWKNDYLKRLVTNKVTNKLFS